MFHLTKWGNEIVATGIIQSMVSEQAKMMNKPADPILVNPGQCPLGAADKPKAPYATTGGDGDQKDKCHVHVTETQNCAGDANNLAVELKIWDAAGNEIGHQDVKKAGATSPLPVNSKLENPLIITPEHQGDYVQFSLGSLQFSTKDADTTKDNWCSTGGWDPREGPACGRFMTISVSILQSRGATVETMLTVTAFVEEADGLLLSMPI